MLSAINQPESIRPRLQQVHHLYSDSVCGPLTMAPVRRHAYEAQFKLQAISYAVLKGNRAAAKEFNINESMVRNWRKQEAKLRRAKETKQSFRGNKARWPQLEDQLEDWITEERSAGRSVSTLAIRLQATAIARDLKIQHFRGGPSWCFRFMRRRHLSIRQKTATPAAAEDYDEKLSVFRSYICSKITDQKIPPHRVTGVDEVALSFDVTVESGKPALTVVLGCHGNGQKLPAMVILRRKTLPKDPFPAGVVVRANQRGRMDEEDMRAWLREVYLQRPNGYFHASPSLLICDATHAHLTATAVNQAELPDSELVVVPAGLTNKLQPLHTGVIRAFKVRWRAAWERWMTDGGHTSKTGRPRRASYATICEWVLDAWAQVSDFTVIRAFARAGLIPEPPPGNETDSDEKTPDIFDGDMSQEFSSDAELETLDGYEEED
uniref:HTH CENPB-type domain-containing protein n=1 Tax=Oryzias melastigma TaxID=30732 RepID=A0A3B3CPS1_ORYME